MANYVSKLTIDNVLALIRDTAAQTLCANLRNDLTTETTDRKSADTALGGRIDSEASALGGRIDSEASARESADTALSSRIDSETNARKNADTTINNRIDLLSVAVTPEMYGAKGDGTTDDTNAINQAIKYAKENNLYVTSLGKKYLITADITIDGAYVDFNNGTIVSNNFSLIVKNNGVLKNAILNSTTIISNDGNNTIQYITIKEWDGAAILIDGGFECFIDHIRLAGNKKTETIGIDIHASDCTVGFIYGYGAHTGIRIRGADNIIHDAHLWLNSNNLFDGSSFIEYNNTFNSFISCACDSYETMCNVTAGALQVSFIGCLWLNNNTLFKNKSFVLFKVPTNTIFANGDITCRLTGLSNNGSTIKINKPTNVLLTAIDGDFIDYTSLTGAQINSHLSTSSASVTSASKIVVENNKLYVSVAVRCDNNSEITIDLTGLYMSNVFSGAVYGTAVYNTANSNKAIDSVLAEIANGTITIKTPDILSYSGIDTAVFNFTLCR